MTTSIPPACATKAGFTDPAPAQRLERAAAALNAEYQPGRGTVLLLRAAIGF